MPSIVTHHLFAKDVYHNLPIKIQSKISYPHYLLFAQSFDNLFYYKFLTPWKGKEIRTFGEQAQQEKVNLYFENIIKEIENKNWESKEEILGYLYGSICHYILDYHCHPFIFYHTGNPHQNKKYRGLHEKMEVNLDAYLYKQKTKKDLYKESLANILLPKVTFSKELIHMINIVFYKTFQKEKIGEIYKESAKTGNFLLKVGVTDKKGLKKRLYKIKDLLSPLSTRKYEYLSFHVTKFYEEYQNNSHEIWNNPADKNRKSTKSFLELYEDALKKATYLINETEKYFKSKKDFQELLLKIGNYSYTTGLPCDKPYTLKYFKD